MKVSRLYDATKYRLKSTLPDSVWAILARNFQKKREKDFSEHNIFSPQGRALPRIFVIRRRPPGGGLFSNVNHVLQGIEYANENGLTPVVDMQNYWTTYSQQKTFHKTNNAWEYFFEPISKFKVDDIATFQNVTLSKGDRIKPSSPLADRGLKFVLNKNLLREIHGLYAQNIRLNAPTLDFLNRVKEFLEWDINSIGVSYRGTDYVSIQPTGHAKQPSLPQLISRIEKMQEKFLNDRLFVATEDAHAKKIILQTDFHSVYKDFRNESTLRKFISNGHSASKQVLNSLGYLAEVYLLSECRTITCSIANGSATSLVINGGRYIEPDIIDLGTY
jgi:hypothetical protein